MVHTNECDTCERNRNEVFCFVKMKSGYVAHDSPIEDFSSLFPSFPFLPFTCLIARQAHYSTAPFNWPLGAPFQPLGSARFDVIPHAATTAKTAESFDRSIRRAEDNRSATFSLDCRTNFELLAANFTWLGIRRGKSAGPIAVPSPVPVKVQPRC